MAKTHGHGNPNWTREEVILALDLYLDCEGIVPGKGDARVVELSAVLRQLPAHAESSKQLTFRNVEGVAFKLQNIRQVATGKGLGNVSSVDRAVWNELGAKRVEVKQLAAAIRKTIDLAKSLSFEEVDEVEFVEGSSATQTHRRRERNPRIRDALVKRRLKSGELSCDICGLNTNESEAALADSIFEAHHVIPLSSTEGLVKTRVQDMALLCANCHRMLHRAISVRKAWVGISEARAMWRNWFGLK